MKIAAIFGDVDSSTSRIRVSKMCEAQLAHEWHSYDLFQTSGGVIGVVRTSERYGSIPMLFQSEQGNILAIAGVPTKEEKLNKHLEAVLEMSSAEATNALTELDGAYAALFWNNTEKSVTLITDFMGFQPIYFHRGKSSISIASEIKAFAVAGVVPPVPDTAGWGAFVVFGHTVGDVTQLKGVSRLRGVKLHYSVSTDTLKKGEYWNWPDRKPEMTLDDVPLEPIVDCLRKDIDAYNQYGTDLSTLLMSSGFDSRLLLCLLDETDLPIQTLSVQQLGHYFGAEGKIGYNTAKEFGVTNAELVLPKTGDQGEVSKLRYMIMNDVATYSLSLHILRVADAVCGLSGSVWDGYSPGYSLHFPGGDKNSYIKKYLSFSLIDTWKAAASIFIDPVEEEMRLRLLELVQLEYEQYGDDDYGVLRFVARNRGLNRVAPNPLQVFANSTLPFTPGMSKAYWNHAFSIPPQKIIAELRLFKKIYTKLFSRALNQPFCNEKGLYMFDNRFSFTVWKNNLLYELLYKWERRHKVPGIGRFIGKKKQTSTHNGRSLIEVVLNKGNLDDPELMADAVTSLLSKPSLSPLEWKARNLLFYRSLWQLMMNGDVSLYGCREWLIKEFETVA